MGSLVIAGWSGDKHYHGQGQIQKGGGGGGGAGKKEGIQPLILGNLH